MLDTGKMYFNTVQYFCDLERDNQDKNCRGDKHEGLSLFFNSENVRITFNLTPIGFDKVIIDKNNGLIGDVLIHNNALLKSNLYSIVAITLDDIMSNNFFSNQFLNFGDSALIIMNPKAFLEKLHRAMGEKEFAYSIGLVEYFPETYQGEIGIFKKQNKYAWQKECRIHIERFENNPFILEIGSLRDIAELHSANDIIKLHSVKRDENKDDILF